MAEDSAAQPGTWTDPYRTYNFKLDIQGVTQGHFTECSGLHVEVESIRYREGGLSQVEHKIPGQVKYGDVTLRYGLTSSTELWEWFMAVVDGNVTRKHVTITLLGSDGTTPVVRWDLIDCWPSQWTGAPLDASLREIAIESVTLACTSIKRG